MKRAILVLGPESSGNRLTLRLLLAAGCYGDFDRGRQSLDKGIPDKPEIIAWLRSVPHGEGWPNIIDMVEDLRKRGRYVDAVVCLRDPFCCERSQVACRYVPDMAEACRRRRTALEYIFTALMAARVPYHISIYEAVLLHPREAVASLMRRLRLPDIELPEEIVDGNAKHYDSITTEWPKCVSCS